MCTEYISNITIKIQDYISQRKLPMNFAKKTVTK